MIKNNRQKLRNPPWSRDELILALNLYMKYQGSAPKKNDQELLRLSSILNKTEYFLNERNKSFRNPAGIYMKLMNFRRFDSAYTSQGKSGLKQGGQEEKSVWDRYSNNLNELQSVSEAIIEHITNPTPNKFNECDTVDLFVAEEGNLLTKVHSYRERSRKIVVQKIAAFLKTHGKLFCEVCEIDFQSIYGDRGMNCIEVHHIKPLSQLLPADKTFIKDLAILCANCHRIIHARRPWLTLDALRSLLTRKC